MQRHRRTITMLLSVALGLALVSAYHCPAQDGSSSTTTGVRPVVVFGPLAESAPAGNAGLFVGVNRFTNDRGLNELAYAVHDAIETAYLFVFELKLIPAANCHLLLSGEPSSDSVKQHLAQLEKQGARIGNAQRGTILTTFLDLTEAASSERNIFVCSFSSHGFNEGRTAYVMPSDGNRRLLADTAVKLESIETAMEESKAGHRLLLVDACQERVSAKSGGQAGKQAEAAFIEALKQPTGQAKLASCSPGEFSFEDANLGGVGHGVFTHSFLEALRGGAKPDADNVVRLGSVAEYVALSVSSWTKTAGRQKQTPFLESPLDARKLPLATKADDVSSLIATIRRLPLTDGLTADFRKRVADALEKVNPSLAADRQFLATTKKFADGEFEATVFIPYATRELDRLLPPPLKAGDERSDNGLKMKLVWCPPGRFTMGSPKSERLRNEHENQVQVTLSHGYWLGKYEVTQHEWQTVMGTTPWSGKSFVMEEARNAASYISHYGALEFCRKLTSSERAAGRLSASEEYRLPTEAEWEYACRAGTTTAYSFGGDEARMSQYVPYAVLNDYFTAAKGDPISEDYAHEVGLKRPNAWGLHDMHGNVWEWCGDWYDKLSGGSDPKGPQEPVPGKLERSQRGGSWRYTAHHARSAYRGSSAPEHGWEDFGFRVIRSPIQE